MKRNLLKPYDFQVNRRPEEMADDYYLGENTMPSMNMLIGYSEKRKDQWILRYTKEEDVVFYSPINNDYNEDLSFSYGQMVQRWKFIRRLKAIAKNKANSPAVILTGNDFLRAKDRIYLLNLFPNYRKCAIVWEDQLEEMKQLGYERPTVNEGFSDFTYYIS